MKMFNVYFENRFDERIFIGEAKDDDQIYQLIKQDISVRAKPSFQWCYTRTWTNKDGEKTYDVGSWSEFYIAVPIS